MSTGPAWPKRRNHPGQDQPVLPTNIIFSRGLFRNFFQRPTLTLLKNAPSKPCYIRKCSAEIFRSSPLAKNFTRSLPGFNLVVIPRLRSRLEKKRKGKTEGTSESHWDNEIR